MPERKPFTSLAMESLLLSSHDALHGSIGRGPEKAGAQLSEKLCPPLIGRADRDVIFEADVVNGRNLSLEEPLLEVDHIATFNGESIPCGNFL